MPEHAQASAGSDSDLAAPAPGFNVRDFARTASGSHRDALHLERYADRPLSTDTRRLLGYLNVIERATMTHLRSVLVTATHKDARITAFLVTWAYEKYWIADALEQILFAHLPEGAPRDTVFRTPEERTIRESIVANVIGVPMIAVHMSLGTVDEWITQAAYARIAELESHPQLTATLASLGEVKARQLTFFEAQARFRLEESPRARRLTRRRLARTPWPIGAKAEPAQETRFFFDHLFASAPHLVAELDARIDTLPGQSGLALVRRAVES